MIETPSVAKHSNPNTSTELSIFDALENMGHEQVVVCSNPETGLKAIIAIHNTTLGPALGELECGCITMNKKHLKMYSVYQEE